MWKSSVNASTVDFTVVSFLDNHEKIIPFLNKYPMVGVKVLDFLDFCKVAELIKNKEHLTLEGLEKIKKIKSLLPPPPAIQRGGGEINSRGTSLALGR